MRAYGLPNAAHHVSSHPIRTTEVDLGRAGRTSQLSVVTYSWPPKPRTCAPKEHFASEVVSFLRAIPYVPRSQYLRSHASSEELCMHLNRIIRRYYLDMIYTRGLGHGGPAVDGWPSYCAS